MLMGDALAQFVAELQGNVIAPLLPLQQRSSIRECAYGTGRSDRCDDFILAAPRELPQIGKFLLEH